MLGIHLGQGLEHAHAKEFALPHDLQHGLLRPTALEPVLIHECHVSSTYFLPLNGSVIVWPLRSNRDPASAGSMKVFHNARSPHPPRQLASRPKRPKGPSSPKEADKPKIGDPVTDGPLRFTVKKVRCGETVTAFHGQHAPLMLVVLDEAGGIPGPLWAAAKSLITGRNNWILAIGNPDDPTSEFEKICPPGSGWNVITISTFDTPNFTGEDVP